jgi:hypothetical protein
MKSIYVASSWRNNYQPQVVQYLRACDFTVYDFKNPRPGDNGFHWSEIDPAWKDWSVAKFRGALAHPIAEAGFASDMNALKDAWATVLVLPCGRSAHLELGYAAGARQVTAIYAPEPTEPELMYKMCDLVTADLSEIAAYLKKKAA